MIRMSLRRVNKGALGKFADKHPRQANYIVSVIADRLAEFIRITRLSGQVLRERSFAERAQRTRPGRPVRTRSTKESTRFFKMGRGHTRGAGSARNKIQFGVRPGSGIRGRLNYLMRFERGDPPGPFMEPAFKDFRRRGIPKQIATGLMDRFIRAENRRSSGQATDA
jgi:hypothetical protein